MIALPGPWRTGTPARESETERDAPHLLETARELADEGRTLRALSICLRLREHPALGREARALLGRLSSSGELPLFSRLDPPSREFVLASARVLLFAPGESVRAEEPGARLLLVARGELALASGAPADAADEARRACEGRVLTDPGAGPDALLAIVTRRAELIELPRARFELAGAAELWERVRRLAGERRPALVRGQP